MEKVVIGIEKFGRMNFWSAGRYRPNDRRKCISHVHMFLISHWPGESVCLVHGFLARCHNGVLKLLINRRPFFRAANQQPAEVLAKCDLCYTSPCQNGGFCEALPDRKFRCKCAPGYHGDRCEHKIDACYGNPCGNTGTCKVLEEGRFRYQTSWLIQRREYFWPARSGLIYMCSFSGARRDRDPRWILIEINTYSSFSFSIRPFNCYRR